MNSVLDSFISWFISFSRDCLFAYCFWLSLGINVRNDAVDVELVILGLFSDSLLACFLLGLGLVVIKSIKLDDDVLDLIELALCCVPSFSTLKSIKTSSFSTTTFSLVDDAPEIDVSSKSMSNVSFWSLFGTNCWLSLIDFGLGDWGWSFLLVDVDPFELDSPGLPMLVGLLPKSLLLNIFPILFILNVLFPRCFFSSRFSSSTLKRLSLTRFWCGLDFFLFFKTRKQC